LGFRPNIDGEAFKSKKVANVGGQPTDLMLDYA